MRISLSRERLHDPRSKGQRHPGGDRIALLRRLQFGILQEFLSRPEFSRPVGETLTMNLSGIDIPPLPRPLTSLYQGVLHSLLKDINENMGVCEFGLSDRHLSLLSMQTDVYVYITEIIGAIRSRELCKKAK
jgi:hypothetical protein